MMEYGGYTPYDWCKVLIISYGDDHIPLLHLVDETDPQEIGFDSVHVIKTGQDMQPPFRIC